MTDTEALIHQALRELQIEGLEVKASTANIGSYDLIKTETITTITMGCEYKAIIAHLKSNANLSTTSQE